MKRFLLILSVLFLSVATANAAGHLITNPRFQVIDDNGNPVARGKVYSYIAGTSTAKSLYSDRAMTSAYAQGFSLDNDGSKLVYGTGTYKINVKTAAGGQVPGFPVDNVGFGEPPGAAYYYPSSDAADHGATGDSNTIKYYVDTIGTTNKATIFLRHDSGSEFTDYDFGTSDNYTSNTNISFVFEQGARVVPAAGKTVTFPSPENLIAAPRQQIFSGSGTIAFATDGQVYPQWWGAVADGSTAAATQAATIQKALDASPIVIFPHSDNDYDVTKIEYNEYQVLKFEDVTIAGDGTQDYTIGPKGGAAATFNHCYLDIQGLLTIDCGEKGGLFLQDLRSSFIPRIQYSNVPNSGSFTYNGETIQRAALMLYSKTDQTAHNTFVGQQIFDGTSTGVGIFVFAGGTKSNYNTFIQCKAYLSGGTAFQVDANDNTFINCDSSSKSGTGGTGYYITGDRTVIINPYGENLDTMMDIRSTADHTSIWNQGGTSGTTTVLSDSGTYTSWTDKANEYGRIYAGDILDMDNIETDTLKWDYLDSRNGQYAASEFVTTSLTCTAGASKTWTNGIPAGSLVLGVTTRITTAIGVSNGTDGYLVGYTGDTDAWGDVSAVAGDTTSGIENDGTTNGYQITSPRYFTTDTNLILTATGGNFDGTGVIRVSIHYIIINPPTS